MSGRVGIARAAFVVGTVAVAGGAGAWVTLGLERSADLMATSSEACLDCHRGAGDHLEAHAELACQECHTVGASALALAWASILGAPSAPEHGQTSGGACRSCHEADPARFRARMQSSGHRAHVLVAGLACTDCHASTIHGGAVAPRCQRCHEDVPLHGLVGEGDCVTCHGFRIDDRHAHEETELASARPLDEPIDVNVAPFTAGLARDRMHSAGDCRGCHDPHSSPEAETDCSECHRGALAEQVARAPERHQDCMTCHEPHGPRAAPAVPCVECHTPPAARSARARDRGDTGTAWAEIRTERTGAPVDTRTLTHDARCGTCHTPHGFVASPNACRGCHEDPARAIATAPEQHGTCTGCHDPHVRIGTEVCSSCHRQIPRSGGPPQHAACNACHDPHGGRPTETSACGRCHRDVPRQLASGPAPHQACTSCHDVHGDPTRGGAAPCAACHRAQASTVLRPGSPAPHRACESCHQPHELVASEAQSCDSCHAAIVRAAASWPRGNAHTQACETCHTTHAVSPPPACRNCHAPQANRQHTGAHRECNACHAVHGEHPGAAGWFSTCAGCHGAEARGLAGAPGAHAECSSCHSPVGRTPPTCTSCHQAITSTLMHQKRGHQRCADCHGTHAVTAAPTRAQCVECHEEQATGHFPEATNCASCHPFAR